MRFSDERFFPKSRIWVTVLILLALAASACAAEIEPDISASVTLPGEAQAEGDASVTLQGPELLDEGVRILPDQTAESVPPETTVDEAAVSDESASDAGQPSENQAVADTSTDAPVGTPDVFVETPCVAPADSTVTGEAPASVVSALEAAAGHPDFAGLDVSVSVWIDGWGEVLSHDADLALVPASNEKILVAHAANELLDPSSTLETSIEQVGSDLVFRAGGDPTFSTWRAHLLIDQVIEAGITSADRLVIDVSEFPQPAAAPGWQGWQLRNFVGPLSGFMLDDNRWNTTEEFLEAPATLNGEWLSDTLQNRGVSIGSVELGNPDPGQVVATVQSEPISELVSSMMLFSDNQIADMLVLQLGLVNGQGTLADGIAQIEAELAELCVPLSGVMDDGSGLSRANHRSAREFQEILRAMRDSDTADVFETQLPVGGISGTLGGRFGGDPWRVRAKTGTIFGGRALSGYATTDSGREAVFSILINGERDRTSASLGAMDALVRQILRS